MARKRSDATEEETFWGEWRRLDDRGRTYGYIAGVVPSRLPMWVPALFHTGVESLIGTVWAGVVWGPPWRVMVMRQHRHRVIVRTATFTAGMHDDLETANVVARQIDAQLAAGRPWEPEGLDPS